MRSLGLAHYWQRLLDEGNFRPITEIDAAEGMDSGQASRIAKLVQLAPEIVEAFMANEINASPLESLLCRSFPAGWDAQEQALISQEG